MSRRRRPLGPEEEALWDAVARTAKPMHAPVVKRKPKDAPAPLPQPATQPAPAHRIAPFRLGEKPGTPKPNPAPPSALQMDAKAFGKLTRGKLAPESRIDLHGMTLAEAHPELIRFILNAHGKGLRLVLVITGKGKPGMDTSVMPRRTGILRQQLPHWLRQQPLASAILQVTEAHLRHGGHGAFYVYLRRSR
ncbi:DNA mismatch repair protein MutS [Pseudorhodobacter turbinis]|uniref:DNA mismatch repair protein MutS n=1 Tax=Pseudorhodobacter turbinis TaxID=2500533 RepID=A0A4V1E0T6_9RHOB|nr:Smr/MutS family protein [Pseudorhodobacter turbinis]QCO55764.1 DNA mismatch repair protein MutS [Pseudorhodobacter turbinis]